MVTIKTVTNRLGVARMIARQRAPYFRKALLNCWYIEKPGLGTVAITEDFILYYDPVVFEWWDDEEVAFVLVHEIYHPLMRHFARGAGVPKEKLNIAADLADNQAVKAMGFKPVPGALFPEQYALPPNLSLEQYLALLPDDAKPTPMPEDGQQGKGKNEAQDGQYRPGNGEPKPGQPQVGGDGQQQQSQTGSTQAKQQPGQQPGGEGQGNGPRGKRPGTCRGHCGSGAGNPVPGESEPGARDAEPTRPKSEVERIRRSVAEAIREEASKGRGTVPAGLARWSHEFLAPPKIRWQDRLAAMARNAIVYRPGAVDYKFNGISRRQGGIGFGPGKPMLPKLREPRPRVVFIGDTSASMGKAEMRSMVSEGHGVLAALGAEMTFLANDAKLHVAKPVRSWQAMTKLLVGGGGTDLRPAFQYVERMKPRPEIIIVFTDGQVGDGIPARPPLGTRVLWVLAGPHRQKPPCSWGQIVEVE